MIDIKLLSQSYKKIELSFQNNKDSSSSLDEVSHVIFSNTWIRIFLIGNAKTNKIYLQVEVSAKEDFRTLSSSESGFSNAHEKSAIMKKFLSDQINALEHLLKLADNDFFLEYISEEGIWSGTKTLEEKPSEELCELISPPY